MANELGELIKSRKKNDMLNSVLLVASDEIKSLEQENAELREMLSSIVERLDCGECTEHEFRVLNEIKQTLFKLKKVK